MPIATFIVIGLLIYNLVRRKDMKEKWMFFLMLSVLCSILQMQGYLFKFGDFEFSSLRKLTGMFCAIYSFYVLIKLRKYNSPIIIVAIFFLLSVALGICIELAIPYDGEIMPVGPNYSWDLYAIGTCSRVKDTLQIVQAARLFGALVMFSVIAIAIKEICTKEDLLNLVKKLLYTSQFVIYFGIFEFVMKNIIGDLTTTFDIVGVLFGERSASFKEAFKKGSDFYTLQGIAPEPSLYIVSLFFVAILLIFFYEHEKYYFSRMKKLLLLAYFVLLNLLMYFAGGFTYVWCLLILILYLVNIKTKFYRKSLLKKCQLFAIVVALIIAAASFISTLDSPYLAYYIDRSMDAYDVFLDLLNGGNPLLTLDEGMASSITRLSSIVLVASDALSRPLFGLGLGLEFAQDNTATMFADIGLVGIALWMMFMNYRVRKDVRYDNMAIVILILLYGVFSGYSTVYMEYYVPLFVEMTRLYVEEK